MTRTMLRAVAAVLWLGVPAARGIAQQAVIVSGHVTGSGGPVAGARVRISDVSPPIERTTDVNGRYSLVIPSANVRGQRVAIVAMMPGRRPIFGSRSATITLTGGAIVQDFDLPLANAGSAEPATGGGPSQAVVGRDTTAGDHGPLTDVPGSGDLSSALAGRVPGFVVRASATPGGSSSITYRGPRSMLLQSQPLYVLDGLILDNTVYTSAAERFGLGGFDYGSPLADINVSNIASWELLSGADAVARYGGRGANGVILLTSKTPAEAGLFSISADQQVTSESIGRLPALQNQYGQGLNGKFEFFNGRGGGVNDAVDQNWGPALNGQPVAQASYHEAGRADVRLWTAQPDNVRDYFTTGRTLNTNAAVQSYWSAGSLRASFGDRNTRGATPGDRLNRRDGAIHLGFTPSEGVNVAIHAFVAETKNTNAPGLGYNVGNPVSQFTRLGRQVSADSLRANLRDAAGNQISWNYAAQNNPFFAALANSNDADRHHSGASASVTAPLAPGVTATASGGTDYSNETRRFTIAPGWMGGFPFYAGDGSFTKGGFQGDEAAERRSNATLRFDALRGGAQNRWEFAGGLDFRTTNQRARSAGVDSIADVPSAGAPDTATIPKASAWSAASHSTSVFGTAGWSSPAGIKVTTAARGTAWSLVEGHQSTAVYPSVSTNLDLRRLLPALRGAARGASLSASIWREGNDISPFDIASAYAGRAPTGSLAPAGSALLVASPSLEPEATLGWQFGGDVQWTPLGLHLGADYYHEHTTGVVLPVSDPVLHTVTAQNAGALTNSGVQARVGAQLGDGRGGLGWTGDFNVLRNVNVVDELPAKTTSIDLGPPQFGLAVQARVGQPLGVLVGTKVRRDAATGALLLDAGLPTADPAGPQILGSMQPKWQLGLTNTFSYGWLSLFVRADARLGGEVFSATNLWGSYSGTLASTSFRPDSGLLVVGLDAGTKAANAKHVSTQDYFHALGSIQQPWVYSASYAKIREARFSLSVPLSGTGLPFSELRASLIGANVWTWAKAPNIDPEALLSLGSLGGLELGQLPYVRTLGFQLTLTP